jgi:hypothetical protein
MQKEFVLQFAAKAEIAFEEQQARQRAAHEDQGSEK